MPVPILKREHAGLLVIDMQPRLLNNIIESARIESRCIELMQLAERLAIPIFITEQNPKKLGHTEETLNQAGNMVHKYDKMSFSAAIPAVLKDLMQSNVSQVIVCGIEAHICVQRSCLELVANGYTPFLISDACGSGLPDEKEIALNRLSANGVQVTSTEACLFELLETAENKEFKFVQGIAIERRST